MTERNSFDKDVNFNNKPGFSRVKFGIDKPVLEVELNEMQKIQEEKRASIVRKTVPTGFLEIVKKDFNGVEIIHNPIITTTEINDGIETVKSIQTFNSIAIAPAKLMVNGYEVDFEGTATIDGIKGYTVIDLGTSSLNVDNFIFLELWFEEINSISPVYKYGFMQGEIIKSNIVDERVGDETSRRVALRHKIRVEKINLSKSKNGFESELKIHAQGPLGNSIPDDNYSFLSAQDNIFKETDFYGDSGLYVAGRETHKDSNGEYIINKSFGILQNFIFAVPLFGVKRRNSGGYSQLKPNGAIEYIDASSKSDRPDGLFNNLIDEKDIFDLRKSISFGQLNTTKLLEDNLKKLMTGHLNTNLNETMVRAQFGIPPVDSFGVNYLSDTILHLDFSNQTLLPKVGTSPTTNGGDIRYHLSALGYGLSLDGKLVVEYPVSNFDKTQGTIEFLLKPYWDGADQSISQTIFSVVNETNVSLIQLVKENGNLVLKQKYNGAVDAPKSVTEVDLAIEPMNNNEIYHIRISWSSEIAIFINGKKVATKNYIVSALTPNFVRLGAVENINAYSSDLVGCLIDEFIIYNKKLDDETFNQLSDDVKIRESRLHNSFNGKLTGFRDNEHSQITISAVSTTLDATEFILESPYGTRIITENAKVYDILNGREYVGTWSLVDEDNAKFKLTSSPTGQTKFTGETLWITHDILVPGGLGIKEVPTKILEAQLDGKDASFANINVEKREIKSLGESGINNIQDEETPEFIEISSYTAFDYSSSSKDTNSAFARLVECNVLGNGTNIYKVPRALFGREVLGIKYVNRSLITVYKEETIIIPKVGDQPEKAIGGNFVIELLDSLGEGLNLKIEIALGGFAFDYETHTKSLAFNMMKATTIKIPINENQKEYVISTSKIIDNSSLVPNGGIITAFLNLKGSENGLEKDFGQTVFITGNVENYLAEATIEGIGTPFIKLALENMPVVDHFIEIPVLITYQPKSSEILSIWYEYSPYQGILNDNIEKKVKRISDWKIFATTFGSGKIVTKNISERSINNASNRLPGGQNYSYLLDGKDINFVTEQMTVSSKYSANKKLLFRTQFTELIENDEYDAFSNILTTEFTIKKRYGKNYQDAFIESSIDNIGFVIQDTWEPISKYLGAACLVTDEDGNVLLFVMGEIVKDPTVESIIRPIHGDLFKLETNPIIIT